MMDQIRVRGELGPLERATGVANLVLAAAQPAAAYVTRLTGRGVSEAERAQLVDGPVSPAPGTFVIWLPLFARSLVQGVHLTRARPSSPALRRVAWLATAAYACNSAWSLHAQLRGLGWPSVAIIASGATSAIAALVVAERYTARSPEADAASNAIAPLAGWLTLATFANAEATLNETSGRPGAKHEATRALALLAAASVAGGVVAVASRRNRLYTGAIAWGLGGVVVRNVRDRNPKVAAAACLGLCAFLAASVVGRR